MFPKFDATDRYELLEIQIPANVTQTKFLIPDQPQLRSDQDADIIIQGLEVFDIDAIPLSPANVPLVTAANLKNTYLTLYVEGEESLYRIPLVRLNIVFNAAANSPAVYSLFSVRNKQVDWTKSYFSTPIAYGAGAGATFSFLIGVHYVKLPAGTMTKIQARQEQLYANP
jgi:hypothetical protein